MNPDKLCVNLFKGFDFTGGQSFHFPIGISVVAAITVLRYRAACEKPNNLQLRSAARRGPAQNFDGEFLSR